MKEVLVSAATAMLAVASPALAQSATSVSPEALTVTKLSNGGRLVQTPNTTIEFDANSNAVAMITTHDGQPHESGRFTAEGKKALAKTATPTVNVAFQPRAFN